MPTDTHSVRLVSKGECAGTGTFRFERPEGYAFRAGQYMMLSLTGSAGSPSKPFSICAGPSDPHLEICTRMTGSPFKQALGALRPGDEVGVSDPLGRLAMPDGPLVVFLGGGVGITPLRSMIRDEEGRRGTRLVLFYGNNTVECIPYREELDATAASDTSFEVVHVIAQAPEGWTGERGFITPEVVRRHVDEREVGHWVCTGPPAMTDAMKRVLTSLSVPGDRVTYELFAGY